VLGAAAGKTNNDHEEFRGCEKGVILLVFYLQKQDKAAILQFRPGNAKSSCLSP
jgi:hypothetical protein